MSTLKREIYYLGVKCRFKEELKTINEADSMLNHYRCMGKVACCLHNNGKHQLYVGEN